jgi:hypothetical protein
VSMSSAGALYGPHLRFFILYTYSLTLSIGNIRVFCRCRFDDRVDCVINFISETELMVPSTKGSKVGPLLAPVLCVRRRFGLWHNVPYSFIPLPRFTR